MLSLYFGNWTFWEDYNAANGIFGNQKVTFDGPNKLILINPYKKYGILITFVENKIN